MALTDFWELKDNMVYKGKPALNVYHAKRILAGADALEVALAFANTILNASLLGLQPTILDRTNLLVENMGDPTDFVALDTSALGGTDTGQIHNTFTAATIQFNRTRTDMKNGQKRLAVGSEADDTNGVWTATFLAQLDTVADNIISAWDTAANPGIDVCNYVILKRFCVDPLEDPCTKYRLPNTNAEIDGFHYVPIFHTIRDNVRSQVSRKIL